MQIIAYEELSAHNIERYTFDFAVQFQRIYVSHARDEIDRRLQLVVQLLIVADELRGQQLQYLLGLQLVRIYDRIDKYIEQLIEDVMSGNLYFNH